MILKDVLIRILGEKESLIVLSNVIREISTLCAYKQTNSMIKQAGAIYLMTTLADIILNHMPNVKNVLKLDEQSENE